MIAPFVTTKDYVIGDFVKYDGDVYEFTSNHTAGAWNSSQVAERPWLVKGLFDTAKIRFTCNPYMFEAVDSQITLTETSSFTNPGSATALPMIQVNGSGDASFSVNGNEIQISDMTANVPVYIDCDAGYVYTASGATEITGGFPELEMGTNTITIGSGVTSLVITPHWRWV